VILVDTNILIDVLSTNSDWQSWSLAEMTKQAIGNALCINDIVYAELSARYGSQREVDAVVHDLDIHLERLPRQALYLAGRAFAAYRAAGGPRTSILSDFFIGAHADVAGLTILTRDTRRYRSYFPNVALIAPGLV
jgi:predicted nucleic acid-binding protein